MANINISFHSQDDSQVDAVKAFMKSLKIKFEISKERPIELSKEQQQILDSQLNPNKFTYMNAESLYVDLKNKYEL